MVLASPSDKFRCMTKPWLGPFAPPCAFPCVRAFPGAAAPPDSCAFATPHTSTAAPSTITILSAIPSALFVSHFVSPFESPFVRLFIACSLADYWEPVRLPPLYHTPPLLVRLLCSA